MAWQSLLDVFKQQEIDRQFAEDRKAEPVACPVCGWAPLHRRDDGDDLLACPTGDWSSHA